MNNPKWKEVQYADLELFAKAINNWRNTIVNDVEMKQVLSEPFFLRAMFPGVARKMKIGVVVAAEINVQKMPITSLEYPMQNAYMKIWNDNKIPVSFYRSTGPSIGGISKNTLERDQGKYISQDFKFFEHLVEKATYDEWIEIILANIGEKNVRNFKKIIEESPIGFAHSANKSIQEIKDPKERYMRLLDMIVSLAKFGPIDDCKVFGKHCYDIDTMEVDKCDPQFWMDDDIRMKCIKRIEDDRQRFAQKMSAAMNDIKLDALKATIIHLGSLVYVFNQFQLPLAKTEEEAMQMRLNYNDPYKQMILEIQGELDDQ